MSVGILLSMGVSAFADDRTAIAQRIEELGSTSSFDSWPMSDRENARYQSMVSLGEDDHRIKTTWESLSLNSCVLTITAGFGATGKSLPTRQIEIDLQDVSVPFAIAPQNGEGVSAFRISVNNPQQRTLILKGPDWGSWEEREASIKKQVFEALPAQGYLLPVYFPEDRPSPAPELLDAIESYRAQFCADAS